MEKLSWTKLLDYTEENVKINVEQNPGLYWLSRSVKGKGQDVFYLGQSEDLRRRLLEHLQSSEENSLHCSLNS